PRVGSRRSRSGRRSRSARRRRPADRRRARRGDRGPRAPSRTVLAGRRSRRCARLASLRDRENVWRRAPSGRSSRALLPDRKQSVRGGRATSNDLSPLVGVGFHPTGVVMRAQVVVLSVALAVIGCKKNDTGGGGGGGGGGWLVGSAGLMV